MTELPRTWRADLDLADDELAAVAATLSPEERTYAAGILDATRRRRWTAEHGLRRRLLGALLGAEPAEITYVTDPDGKPAVAGAPSPIRFSASRSGALALYVTHPTGEVGIDAEGLRPGRDVERLGRRILAPAERAALDELPTEDRAGAIITVFTRKEAHGKALGTGLAFPLDRTALWVGDERPVTVDGLRVMALDAGPGHAAAVAVPAATPSEWSPQPSLLPGR